MAVSTQQSKKKVKVKVIRPFFMEGEVVKVGEVLTFDMVFAAEMQAAGKVTYDLDQKTEKSKKAVAGVDVAKAAEADAKAQADYNAAVQAEADADAKAKAKK